MENEKSKVKKCKDCMVTDECPCFEDKDKQIDALAKRHAEVLKELERKNVRIERKDERIEELEAANRDLKELEARLTKQPEKWEEGVVVVDETRDVKLSEAGWYWIWEQGHERPQCDRPFKKNEVCQFFKGEIYRKAAEVIPHRPKPIK